MMELRRLALLLLVSALLFLSLSSSSSSQVLGRNAYAAAAAAGSDLISTAHRLQPNKAWHPHPHPNVKEKMKVGRREMSENMIETNDYDDPKANVNPRGGPLLNPTIPTPTPTPTPPTPVTPPPNHSR